MKKKGELLKEVIWGLLFRVVFMWIDYEMGLIYVVFFLILVVFILDK